MRQTLFGRSAIYRTASNPLRRLTDSLCVPYPISLPKNVTTRVTVKPFIFPAELAFIAPEPSCLWQAMGSDFYADKMAFSKNYAYFTPEKYLEIEGVSPIKHEYVQGQIIAMAGATITYPEPCWVRDDNQFPTIILSFEF